MTRTSRERQSAAEKTSTCILRYVVDHPLATRRAAAEDLGLSFPNVCRLMARFQENGLLVEDKLRQTGKRGPRSRAFSLRHDVGCTVGVDLEATQLRAVAFDYSNEVIGEQRQPVSSTASAEKVVEQVAAMAKGTVMLAKQKELAVHAVGLALPGPLIDEAAGRVRTELQTGVREMEFVPAVEKACGVPTFAAANDLCFAIGHHRLRHSRDKNTEMLVLNRFGLSASILRGEEAFNGHLGLLPFDQGSPMRRYQEVCTGASLLRIARERGDTRGLHEIISHYTDPFVEEWLAIAGPAFAQAVYCGIVMYSPNRVTIEGIFTSLPEQVRGDVVRIIAEDLRAVGIAEPAIGLYEGDDLMGARGAALMARDHVADGVLTELVRSMRDEVAV